MLVQLVRLWEIPDRSLRLVIASSAKNSSTRVLILKFLGPLPHVADQIHDAKRARTLRMRINRIRTSHGTPLLWSWYSFGIPVVTPWIQAVVTALRCVLPLPLMRQT